jgi:hypothetical protein
MALRRKRSRSAPGLSATLPLLFGGSSMLRQTSNLRSSGRVGKINRPIVIFTKIIREAIEKTSRLAG